MGGGLLVVGSEGLVVHVPLQAARLVCVEGDVNLLRGGWGTHGRVREERNSLFQWILII